MNPKVYINAAKLIADRKQESPNLAIMVSVFELTSYSLQVFIKYKERFRDCFKDKSSQRSYFFWWNFGDADSKIIALLLMAEIVRDENRSNESKL